MVNVAVKSLRTPTSDRLQSTIERVPTMYVSRKTTDRPDATLAGQAFFDRSASTSSDSNPLPSPNLVNSFDAGQRVFWSRMRPEDGRGCFTMPLIKEMGALADRLRGFHAAQLASGGLAPAFFVSASAIPGTYNLGGDLAHFAESIRKGDRETIGYYGHSCIDAIYENSRSFGLPLTTIALIEGDALGGGLECALSYDVIVAARAGQIGFPAALFNLFPGMGAYTFLSRRIGRAAAERLISSGKTYSAEEAHRDGVIDVLAEDGQGVAEVNRYVRQTSRRMNMQQAVFNARRRVEQITESELRDVVDIWADAAMCIGSSDLRMMDRLATAQRRRLSSGAQVPVAASA